MLGKLGMCIGLYDTRPRLIQRAAPRLFLRKQGLLLGLDFLAQGLASREEGYTVCASFGNRQAFRLGIQ
jgi:hypothetical protein